MFIIIKEGARKCGTSLIRVTKKMCKSKKKIFKKLEEKELLWGL